MSSTSFEHEGSSSGRRLCIQIWYSVFYMLLYKQSCKHMSVFLPTGLHLLMPVKHANTCIHNRLPECGLSGSKRVENFKK